MTVTLKQWNQIVAALKLSAQVKEQQAAAMRKQPHLLEGPVSVAVHFKNASEAELAGIQDQELADFLMASGAK